MSGGSATIEWTGDTLNPWTGCSKVSPGCAHCYIPRTMPFRRAGRKFVGGHIPLVFHMDRLDRMVRKRKPTLYFVNSLSDLFHEDVPDDSIDRVFGAMGAAAFLGRGHTFQVLTKREERMHEYMLSMTLDRFGRAVSWYCEDGDAAWDWAWAHWPLPNVWLGVSIENRRFVHRADLLRDTPAAVRFISAEPLLGPLVYDSDCGYVRDGMDDVPEHLQGDPHEPCWLDGADLAELDLTDIDWLICGGESGPEHRPINPEWVRALRDLALGYGTAFFFKQWGGRTPKSGGREAGRPHLGRVPDNANGGSGVMTDERTELGWAILELMGHRKLAGKVQEATLAGGAFLRIDVCLPDDGTQKAGEVGFTRDDDGAPLQVIATQFYAPSAVYAITPATRDVCLQLTRHYQPEPVTRWELPAPDPDPDDAEEFDGDVYIAEQRDRLTVWFGQGRSDTWIAHQLETSTERIRTQRMELAPETLEAIHADDEIPY